MTMKVALYCRVSTSTKEPTTENQRLELESYCDRMNYEIVKIRMMKCLVQSPEKNDLLIMNYVRMHF